MSARRPRYVGRGPLPCLVVWKVMCDALPVSGEPVTMAHRERENSIQCTSVQGWSPSRGEGDTVSHGGHR
uniref:Putative secreted protein n=1 Tax=Anopheles darlingi TaxID=43151 RepID=A0A2M4D135_ANODA